MIAWKKCAAGKLRGRSFSSNFAAASDIVTVAVGAAVAPIHNGDTAFLFNIVLARSPFVARRRRRRDLSPLSLPSFLLSSRPKRAQKVKQGPLHCASSIPNGVEASAPSSRPSLPPSYAVSAVNFEK